MKTTVRLALAFALVMLGACADSDVRKEDDGKMVRAGEGANASAKPQMYVTEQFGATKIIRPAVKPLWVGNLGRWIDEWKRGRLAAGEMSVEVNRWRWVVGASQPVRGAREWRLARQLASQDAIFHLIRGLGFDFTSRAVGGEVWQTDDTGQVVDGLFRKALSQEFFSNRINFREYETYTHQVAEIGFGGREVYYCVAQMLFRMDMKTFRDQQVMARARKRFEAEIAHAKLTLAERAKANRLAKEMLEKASRP